MNSIYEDKGLPENYFYSLNPYDDRLKEDEDLGANYNNQPAHRNHSQREPFEGFSNGREPYTSHYCDGKTHIPICFRLPTSYNSSGGGGA